MTLGSARVGHRLHRDGPRRRAAPRAAVSRAPFWSLAATTPPSFAPRPTSIWRCAPSLSRRWEPPASAARRCGGCSCTKTSTTSFWPPAVRLCVGSGWRSARGGHARRPADRPETPLQAMRAGARRSRAATGGVVTGGERVLTDDLPECLLRAPRAGRNAEQAAGRATRNLRAHSLCDELPKPRSRRIGLHNGVPHGLASSIFTNDVWRSRALPVRRRLGLRHRQCEYRPVGRGDRRRLRRREGHAAAGAKRDPTSGRPICAAPPTRSTIPGELPLAQGVKFDVGA